MAVTSMVIPHFGIFKNILQPSFIINNHLIHVYLGLLPKDKDLC